MCPSGAARGGPATAAGDVAALIDALSRGRLTLAELAQIPADELDAVFALGAEYLDTQRDADATTLFAGLVTLNPYSAKYWRAYGIALHRLGRLHDARCAYNAALLLDPRSVAIRCYRGEVALYLGDAEMAREDLDVAANCGVPTVEKRARDLVAILTRLESQRVAPPVEAPERPTAVTAPFILPDGRVLPLTEETTRTAQRPLPSTERPRTAEKERTDTALLPRSRRRALITHTAVVRRRLGEPLADDETTEV